MKQFLTSLHLFPSTCPRNLEIQSSIAHYSVAIVLVLNSLVPHDPKSFGFSGSSILLFCEEVFSFSLFIFFDFSFTPTLTYQISNV